MLRGFAAPTKQSYLVGCIVALAKHYRRPPGTLDASAIQAYLLHLITHPEHTKGCSARCSSCSSVHQQSLQPTFL